MKKQPSKIYLVSKELKRKKKVYAKDLRAKCKAGNPYQMVAELRNRYDWQIDTMYTSQTNQYYTLVKAGQVIEKQLYLYQQWLQTLKNKKKIFNLFGGGAATPNLSGFFNL